MRVRGSVIIDKNIKISHPNGTLPEQGKVLGAKDSEGTTGWLNIAAMQVVPEETYPIGSIVLFEELLYVAKIEGARGSVMGLKTEWIPVGTHSGDTGIYGMFTYVQDDAAELWTIHHSLGVKHVAITVYDEDDEVIIPFEIKAVDEGTITVTFPEGVLVAGYATIIGGVLSDVPIYQDIQSVTDVNNVTTNEIEASAHKTTGGTSSEFTKGDGSLDSTKYQIAGPEDVEGEYVWKVVDVSGTKEASWSAVTIPPPATEPSGLEALDEGNGIGYRLINSNPGKYSNIGLGSVDLTTLDHWDEADGNTDYGVEAEYSFSAGEGNRIKGTGFSYSLGYYNNIYSGGSSTLIGAYNTLNSTGTFNNLIGSSNNLTGGSPGNNVIGNNNALSSATGGYGMILGSNNAISSTQPNNSIVGLGNSITSGYGNSIIGVYNEIATDANGFASLLGMNNRASGTGPGGAMGTALDIRGRGQSAVGIANTIWAGGNMDIDRPMFTVGIGTTTTPAGAWSALTRVDGFVVRANGVIEAPALTSALIDSGLDTTLINKKWAQDNMPAAATGLEALDEGSGIGWRLIGRDPNGFTPIGDGSVELGSTYAAVGYANLHVSTIAAGNKYQIKSLGNTDFTALGAASNTVGVQFVATSVPGYVSGEGLVAFVHAPGTSAPVSFSMGEENSIPNVAGSYGSHVAFGAENVVKGYYNNHAFGTLNTIINGYSTFAGGYQNVIDVDGLIGQSFTYGLQNRNTGGLNASLGIGLNVRNKGTVVVGEGNTDSGYGWSDSSRPTFVVGIGDVSDGAGSYGVILNKKDGLVVYKPGQVVAPSLTSQMIADEATGQILTTRKWVEENTGVVALSGTSAERLLATTTPVGVSFWDTDLKIPCYLESGIWYNTAGGIVS